MATYPELHELRSNSDLQERVEVAIAIKGQALIAGATPTTAEITWANAAIASPTSKMHAMLNYILAANAGNTVAQITGASDGTLQTNINTAADALIAGGA